MLGRESDTNWQESASTLLRLISRGSVTRVATFSSLSG
jgi:hypothetical protein